MRVGSVVVVVVVCRLPVCLFPTVEAEDGDESGVSCCLCVYLLLLLFACLFLT